MAATLHERIFGPLQTNWHRLPSSYRVPLIFTSCTAVLITPYIWRRLTYKPELLPPPPKDYAYQKVDDHSATLTLPDGRTLGFAEYGDLNGVPIVVTHGILGSRLENQLFHRNARELGARIIGIDRPGIGLSSPNATNRKVVDHAKEVEALAEYLNLKGYAVIGMSGGGPYALGCARSLPSDPSKPKLKAVSIVTGLQLPNMTQNFPAWLVFLNRNLDLRRVVKWMFTRGPAWQLHLSDEVRAEGMRQAFDLKKAHTADVAITRRADYPDMQQTFLRSSREAARQGWDGFLDDSAILSAAPGFRVEDIRPDLPVQLWYGMDDGNVSPKAGKEYAERLRAGGNKLVELHEEDGHTHGSTQVNYQRRILEDLLRAMKG